MRAPFRILIPLLALGLPGCGGGSGGSSTTPGTSTGPVVDDVLGFPFTGSKSVLFVLVKFEDEPALFPETADGRQAVEALRDGLIDAFDGFTRGLLSFDVDYTWPPLLIPRKTSDYDPVDAFVRVRADALAVARQNGYLPELYDREVLFSPRVWPSQARGWIRTVWMPHTIPATLYHEVGHTLGWGHADFWEGDPLGPGTQINRGDVWDLMGSGPDPNRARHPNPGFKNRAGWLDDGALRRVNAPGTYTLSSIEDHDGLVGSAALVIRRDAEEAYWLFQRDQYPLADGAVFVVRIQSNPFNGNPLLDMNPGSSGAEIEDAPLLPGQSFQDAAAGISFTNVTAPGGAVTVDVVVDPLRQDALDTLPRIGVLSPPQDQGPVAGEVVFRVTAADPDVGDTDGEGILRVTLELLEASTDPFPVLATTLLLDRPYTWTVDTTTLRDGAHYLSATVEALDGGSRTIWYRFLVDNQ